jgi:A/G-specific adenine glycosylase
MDMQYFSVKLIEWYDEHRRDLPWRNTTDPYKIWLSEIILQQTRVNQGLPYYLRFTETFPDVFALASATEQQVLRLWQGLGYYTRARNLHKCYVVADFEGNFPVRYDDLLTLPGIGEYTAAAIASFCAKEKVAVLDGNVFRVLSRLFGETTPINSPEGKKTFSALANKLLSEISPDKHNQAMMEFGATWCTPKLPKCDECIFNKECFAYKNKEQDALPVKIRAKKSTKRYFNYFVVKKGKTILMKKREHKDIWNGLFDFYLVETSKPVKPLTLIAKDDFLKNRSSGENATVSAEYKHVLSHQTIISTFVVVNDESGSAVREESLKYYSLKKIGDLPKPVLISRFLKDYDLL